jgi:hypothetical protein
MIIIESAASKEKLYKFLKKLLIKIYSSGLFKSVAALELSGRNMAKKINRNRFLLNKPELGKHVFFLNM